jgi:hypothetical protein
MVPIRYAGTFDDVDDGRLGDGHRDVISINGGEADHVVRDHRQLLDVLGLDG